MRRKYSKLVRKNIKNMGSLIKQLENFFRAYFSLKLFRVSHPPLLAILIPTSRCNLSCEMCDLWKSKGEELSREAILNVIDDLKKMGVRVISITGGEPLLRKDVFDIMHYIKKRGMFLDLSTNGTLITEHVAERLLETGVDTVSVSFDSNDPGIFDKLRGKRGTHGKVLNGIDNLLRISNGSINTTVNILISPRTLDKIIETVDFLKNLGVKNIGFIPVHNFSGKKYLNFSGEQKNKLKNVIENLIEIKKESGLIDNTEEYLKTIENFVLHGKRSRLCGAGFFTIVINSNGDIYPCFGMLELGNKIGNIRDKNIKDILNSDKFKKMGYDLLHCNKCIWNCHEELNILFDRALSGFARK